MASKQQVIEAARLTLEGKKNTQITKALGISTTALAAMRKTKLYQATETVLAEQLLEQSATLLVGLAHQGLNRLREALSAPLHNMDNSGGPGMQRRLVDPAFLKELRLITTAMYDLALDVTEEADDGGEDEPR